jgi:hypothetical protein
MDNLQSSLSSQEFSFVSKSIFPFTLECFVRAEPVMNTFECARVDSIVIFDIFDIVFLSLFKIDPNDLPIEFALVKQTQRAEYLHCFRLAHPHDLAHTDLHDIEWVVVPVCARLPILVVAVLPGLREHSIVEHGVEHVVTQVPLPRLLIFLHILLHWIVLLICRHLHFGCRVSIFNQGGRVNTLKSRKKQRSGQSHCRRVLVVNRAKGRVFVVRLRFLGRLEKRNHRQ